jgi:hypothetical protein
LLGRGNAQSLVIGGLLAGAFWGVWARGYPALLNTPELSLPIVIAAAVVTMLAVMVLWLAAARLPIDDPALLKLSRIEGGIVFVVIAALVIVYMLRGPVTRDAFSYVVMLIFFCATILWFQSNRGDISLISDWLPVTFSRVGVMLIAGIVFVAVGAGTYLIPPPTGDSLSLLQVLSLSFGAIGLAWLPAVCVVLGVRAYRQSARTGKEL